MIRFALAGLLLIVLTAGCGGQQDPAVRAAADLIVKRNGSFVLHGTTVPIKSAEKIPPGNLSIQKVDLNGQHVTDQELETLKALKSVEILNLQSSYLTDAGTVHLAELKNLRELDLHDSQYFTDKGLESLQGLTRLSKLELSKTRVTSEAVDRLASMKSLSQLHLNNTSISAEAGKKLRESLPNCKVYGPK